MDIRAAASQIGSAPGEFSILIRRNRTEILVDGHPIRGCFAFDLHQEVGQPAKLTLVLDIEQGDARGHAAVTSSQAGN